MVGPTLTQFPATLPEFGSAVAGPDFGHGPIYPGDVLRTDDGHLRVITDTRVSGRGSGIEVFEAEDLSRHELRGQVLEGKIGKWSQVRQRFGYATTLAEEQTRLIGYASRDIERDRYLLEIGETPLGALSVTFDEPVVTVSSPPELLAQLEDGIPGTQLLAVQSLSPGDEAEVVSTLVSEIETAATERLEEIDRAVSAAELHTTEAPIPTADLDTNVLVPTRTLAPVSGGGQLGGSDSVEQSDARAEAHPPEDGTPYISGDRFVWWEDSPPGPVLSPSLEYLIRGECRVLVDSGDLTPAERIEIPVSSDSEDGFSLEGTDETSVDAVDDNREEAAENRAEPPETDLALLDLFDGGTEPATSATVEECRDRALENGIVFRLLGRDCYVETLSDTATVSLHAYAYDGVAGSGYLLAVDRFETAEPRLEHPLSLFVADFDSIGELCTALSNPQELSLPLWTWIEENEQVGHTAKQLARRVADTGAYRGLDTISSDV